MIENITAPCLRCTCEHCQFVWTILEEPHRCPSCRTTKWKTKPKKPGSPAGTRKAEALKQSLAAIRIKLMGKTYKEVGDLMGISRQRAQQLVAPIPSIRKLVRDRSGSACEKCGKPVICGHIHHITETDRTEYDYNSLDNLEMLCTSCHQFHHADFRRTRSTGFTVEKVIEIKKLLNSGETQANIARMFGVHKSTIRDIDNGDNWSNVKVT